MQVDRAATCEQHRDSGKTETSQTSDEAEWDDTILEEQTRAAPNEKRTLHAHLARSETQTHAAARTTPNEQRKGRGGFDAEG